MLSAGNSQESQPTDEREIAVFSKILTKRRYIDWKKQQSSTDDCRPNRAGTQGPFEYLVSWEDGIDTWEPVENLLKQKDAVRKFNDDFEQRTRAQDKVAQKHQNMKLQTKKALKRGSLEKGNTIDQVIGLKRNKFDNQLMCKIAWT